MTAYLAATLDEAAGVAVNVVDDERTSMDEFYRLLAAIYLPDKTFKTITLPFWAGRCLGCFISAVSNLLNLDKPFADPSYYALYSVSHQLDFGHARMKALFERAGRIPITREQGLRELAACATHETMCE